MQSLEDGTAYEIDEARTAAEEWEPGNIVAQYKDGEGCFILRVFLGVTKAGYYLVQDYKSDFVGKDYPPYNKLKITDEEKHTEPFALMSRCAVTDEKNSTLSAIGGISSACGSFTMLYGSKFNGQIEVEGVFLDGDLQSGWVRYKPDGSPF